MCGLFGVVGCVGVGVFFFRRLRVFFDFFCVFGVFVRFRRFWPVSALSAFSAFSALAALGKGNLRCGFALTRLTF